MLKRLLRRAEPATVQSYLGLLKHGNAKGLVKKVNSH